MEDNQKTVAQTLATKEPAGEVSSFDNNYITIKGAREHNLKNISLKIPRNKLVVISGLSGSGKSSLAFDTLFAEGQRRYMQSLSSYARQFLGTMEKPDVDLIEGLSPAIAIEQKTSAKNPRSTVGTITEIYDYYRLLYARCGTAHCPKCKRQIKEQSTDQIIDSIMAYPQNTKIQIIAPIIKGQKGEHKKIIDDAIEAGFVRARIDGLLTELDENIKLDKQKKHTIELVVDRVIVKAEARKRIADSVETALSKTNGILLVSYCEKDKEGKDVTKEEFFSQKNACPDCGISIPELQPRLFSFNNPFGACPECSGLGQRMQFDIRLMIPDESKSYNEHGILPYNPTAIWNTTRIKALSEVDGWSLDTPIQDLTKEQKQRLFYGTKENIHWSYQGQSGNYNTYTRTWPGLIEDMNTRYIQAWGDAMKESLCQYTSQSPCPACLGMRLRKEALGVTIADLNIWQLCSLSVKESIEFFGDLHFSENETKIAGQVVKEITSRLHFLQDVGLEYLTLDRSSGTLSGGEAQRIRLSSQIGSALVGVMYILDEPSIGLHQRDNQKLLDTLLHLRDLGNSVIVVEHDEQTLRTADFLIDMGKGAGIHGGSVIAAGTPCQVEKVKESITGQYLAGKLKMPIPKQRRKGNGKKITLFGVTEHNLKDVSVDIPLGCFSCITGVSGSGKSTLLNDVLFPLASNKTMRTSYHVGAYKGIEGLENIDKVINIDQSPIGRSPRSNPATYIGVFDAIRKVFAQLPLSKAKGYSAGRFSFNVPGGRCEKCGGAGTLTIEMNFLCDVFITCDACGGKRFNQETLEVSYKGKNITDVLDMTIEEACDFFSSHKVIQRKLKTLFDVGLGYITLGQSALTLSGGEAQRVKLAAELSKVATGRTLYILDEPTTGLHYADIMQLMNVVNKLVEAGNTVLMIEHNLDVITQADNLIDLGPEGGAGGGRVIATGTPEEVSKNQGSYTAKFIRQMLEKC